MQRQRRTVASPGVIPSASAVPRNPHALMPCTVKWITPYQARGFTKRIAGQTVGGYLSRLGIISRSKNAVDKWKCGNCQETMRCGTIDRQSSIQLDAKITRLRSIPPSTLPEPKPFPPPTISARFNCRPSSIDPFTSDKSRINIDCSARRSDSSSCWSAVTTPASPPSSRRPPHDGSDPSRIAIPPAP